MDIMNTCLMLIFENGGLRLIKSDKSYADSVDLRNILDIFWRRKWMILVFVAVVTTGVVGAMMLLKTPRYESSTDILQRRSGLDKALIGSELFLESESQPERKMETAAELVVSPEVVNGVSNKLGDRLEGRDPASLVDVNVLKKTDILRVTASDPDPQLAADVANTFAAEYINWRRNVDHEVLQQAKAPIEAQLRTFSPEDHESVTYRVLSDKLESLKLIEAVQTGDLEVVKTAVVSPDPSSPNAMRIGTIAFIASLIGSVGMVFFIEQLDNKVRSVDEIIAEIDKPVLATIPRVSNLRGNGSLLTLSKPSSPGSEAYRLLKTNLSFVEPDKPVKSILLTSATPEDGKSITLANLAVTLARSGRRVIIIEADFRRPILSEYLELEGAIGLTNTIADSCSLVESLQVIEVEKLVIGHQKSLHENRIKEVLSEAMFKENANSEIKPIYCAVSGPLPPNPGELSASEKMGTIITEAGKYADVVLVDSPPIGLVGDAASLAARVDGVILVIKLNHNTREHLRHLRDFSEAIPCKTLGIVATNTSGDGSYYYKYDYY